MWTYFPDDVLPRLRQLPGLGHLPPHMLLGALFPNLHYIFVRRQDRVRQAVSWERAHQTGIWSQRVGERSEPARQPVFDFAAVDRLVRLIEVNEAAWRHFFGEAGGEPLEVVYEEFVRSYEETTLRVLDYLGIEAPPDLKISPPIQRQADSLSDDWARLYHLLKEEARPRPPRNAE